MKRSTLAFAIATAVAFAASSTVAAQGKGHGGGPKPKTTSSAQTPKAVGGGSTKVKTTGSAKMQSPQSAGASAKVQGPKSTGQNAKATGQGKAKTQSTASSVGAGGSSDGSRPGASSSDAPTTSGTLTPVQAKLEKNTNLASKLRSRLPLGTDLLVASDGFRNLGQFVAAVNVSNNLNIPFADLKTRMVTDGMSLGQAIKAERSDVDSIVIARQAERDADLLITQTTTTSKKPKK